MTLLKWLLGAVAVFGCFVAFMYVMQRSLMYSPEPRRTAPAEAGLPEAQEVVLETSDGEKVIAVVKYAMELDADRLSNRAMLRDLRARFDMLTSAERTIFFGILRDRLNKQLAVDLGTCERTIKAQRARMMQKLNVRSVPELVRVAKLLDRATQA